jgi:hypothetical protein
MNINTWIVNMELIMILGNSYVVIYSLFMIKHDHLLKLNLWYEPLFTSELISLHLIDVMSWVLWYEFIFVIMIWTYSMPVRIPMLTM